MKVNITKRIETPEGRRYCPVVVDSNSCVQADWVIVNGRQEKHLKGTYYLDWSAAGKRKRISIGADAAIAGRRLIQKQRELNAGTKRDFHSTQVGSRLRICSAVDDFLEDIQLSRQRKTWMGQTNLKSIIRYLKPARHRTAIAKVNLSFTAYNRTIARLES